MNLPKNFKFKIPGGEALTYYAGISGKYVFVDWDGNEYEPKRYSLSDVKENVKNSDWVVVQDHFNHPFYKKVDEVTEQIKLEQIQKGAEKYPEPFTPDSWTIEQLATHILQELRDAQVYAVGMLDRMEKQKKEIELYKQALEYYATNHSWNIETINEVAKKALEADTQ
jgi:hypothetical protein